MCVCEKKFRILHVTETKSRIHAQLATPKRLPFSLSPFNVVFAAPKLLLFPANDLHNAFFFFFVYFRPLLL